MTDDRRRALAFNAVGPAINDRGYWLPLSARRAVADAVLEAIGGPAEYCGDEVVEPLSHLSTECVLRPGHNGSHANDEGTRWRLIQPAAGYCPHCGRGDAGPTAEAYEELRQRAEQAEAAIERVRALHPEGTDGRCGTCGVPWPCPDICCLNGPPGCRNCGEYHTPIADRTKGTS